MISSISLNNVRLFSGIDANFNISKFFVLSGINSAGKSTLLKSLLLLKQSFGLFENLYSEEGKVRFNGSELDLGDYKEFVHMNNSRRDMHLKFSFNFNPKKQDLKNLIKEHSTRSVTYKMTVDLTLTRNQGNARNSDRKNITKIGYLKAAKYNISTEDKSILKWKVRQSSGDELEQFGHNNKYIIEFPRNYIEQFGEKGLEGGVVAGKVVKFGLLIRAFVPMSIATRIDQGKKVTFEQLPPEVESSLRQLSTYLKDLIYLGPIRSEPQRWYALTEDINPEFDSSGRFLPYLLREHLKRPVVNFRIKEEKPRRETLLSALNYWVHYLKTGEYESVGKDSKEVSIEYVGDKLLGFKLRSSTKLGKHFSVADSGFGFSQVLPIILYGLLLNSRSTIIIEQPELHLNPALQVRIVSFLVGLIATGKQVIIETHSEHIVNTLRVIVAEDKSGALSKECGVCFLENIDGKVISHNLNMNERGMISNWPKSFFGESLTLTKRLLLAQKKNTSSTRD